MASSANARQAAMSERQTMRFLPLQVSMGCYDYPASANELQGSTCHPKGTTPMHETTSDRKDARPPAVELMRHLGLEPDPWQLEVLEGGHQRLLLNCCRQAGKSTVVAMLGLVEALFVPLTRVLLVSRSHRQSTELFRIMTD